MAIADLRRASGRLVELCTAVEEGASDADLRAFLRSEEVPANAGKPWHEDPTLNGAIANLSIAIDGFKALLDKGKGADAYREMLGEMKWRASKVQALAEGM